MHERPITYTIIFGVFKVIISSVHFPTWEMTLAWSPAYPEHFHRSKTHRNGKEKLTCYSVSSLPKGGSTKFKIQRGPTGMLSEVHKNVNRTWTKWRPTSIVVASFHAYLPQCQASMSKDCLSLGVKKLQHSDNSKIWIKTSSSASGTLTRGWQYKSNLFCWFSCMLFHPNIGD